MINLISKTQRTAMGSIEETPLTSTDKKIQTSMAESIWFYMKRRIEFWNRSPTAEFELASAAYHKLVRECGYDESAAILILQEEMRRMEQEYSPYQDEVRRRVSRKERLLTVGLD